MADDYKKKFKDIFELINSHQFKELSKLYSNYDPYHFVHINEMAHSKFIAWLLNPREGHGAGDFFFKKFIEALEIEAKTSSYKGTKLPCCDILKPDTFIFENEYDTRSDNAKCGRLDILAVSPVSGWTIIIENKIGAKLAKNQLDQYTAFADISNRVNIDKTILVVMDANEYDIKDSKSSDKWIPISYEWLGKALYKYLEDFSKLNKSKSLRKKQRNGLKVIMSGYLLEIEEFTKSKHNSHYYAKTYKQIKRMGIANSHIWESKDFKDIWDSEILDVLPDSKTRKENENKAQLAIYNNIDLFLKLQIYNFIEAIKSELDEDGYALDWNARSHLNYTDRRISEKYKLFPRCNRSGRDWALSLSADWNSNTKKYSFRLSDKTARLENKPPEYANINKFLKGNGNVKFSALKKEIKNCQSVDKDKLEKEAKSLGKKLKSIVSAYIKHEQD